MNKYQALFEPVKIGNVTIKNRYALSPIGVYSFDPVDMVINEDACEYFIERARGGVGLLFTGAHSAENKIEKKTLFPCLTTNPTATIKRLKDLTERIHAFDAKFFVQITFGLGRNGPPLANAEDNIAPSETTNYYDPHVIHRTLTTEEIYGMIDAFGKAARIAQLGGADGIDVHSMHGGYLLDLFTMAQFNQRTDEFGGDVRGRCTLPIKLLEVVKRNCGKDFPVSIRLGIKSFINGYHRSALPGVDFVEQGRDTEESLEIIRILDEAGYDCFNIDCGSYDGDYWGKPPVYMPEGTYLSFAEKVKRITKRPVIVSGRLGDPDLALKAVTTGKTDMIAMARPLLADPALPKKVQRGDISDVRPCVACMEGCVNRCLLGKQASCAVNPKANRERLMSFGPAPKARNALVIGGGPAGMEAAVVLAERGHNVTLTDKADALGGKYRFAALPGFKDADEKLIAWFEHTLHKFDVNILLNHEVTAYDPLVKNADVILCATGATPARPPIPGLEKAEAILDVLKEKNVEVTAEYAVIGAGLVGCEFAIWLAKKGVKVHLVEMANEIIPISKPAKMCMQYISEALEHYEIDVRLNTKLVSVEDDGAIVERSGQREFIGAQKIVYSFGFRAVDGLYNELTAAGKEVYNIGDSKHPGNIMPGIWDAYEVCRGL